MNRRFRLPTSVFLIILSVILYNAFFPFVDNILVPLNIRKKITLVDDISIDFFGAVIPTITSFVLVSYLMFVRKFPKNRYLGWLFFATFLCLGLSSVNDAVGVRFVLLDLCLAVLSFWLVFCDGKIGKDIKIDFSKRKSLNSFLMIYSYASLSCLFVDIIYLVVYLPSLSFAYIGANGLIDGIFLSGVFSIFPLTIVVSFFAFVTSLPTFLESVVEYVKGARRRAVQKFVSIARAICFCN